MNTVEIDLALRSDECTRDYFGGVWASDRLKLVSKQCAMPVCFVANTDPSNRPGQHWVAFYFPPSGPAEFFDSYGFEAERGSLNKFQTHFGHKSKIWNRTRMQGELSTACGQYCIYYLTLRCRGYAMDEIVRSFSGDRPDWNWNDSVAVAFVNKHFRLSTVNVDYAFVIQGALSHL